MRLPMLSNPTGNLREPLGLLGVDSGIGGSSGGGTCDCGGAPFGCSVLKNNCEDGFMPNCTNDIFECTCQCMPR